ncbi:pentatricopeptide repeat-containing protein At4g33990-like isoform X1 [Nymphaea colorata]|nr:pentatricopeptide repeat-containing protein At4g33990-like isoform X1 [Nymphaea colorata]
MSVAGLWNSRIKSHVDIHLFSNAICVYNMMRREQVQPDHYTFPQVNRAIAGHGNCLTVGKKVHCAAIKLGFGSDVYVCNTQVEMYARYADMSAARKVFDDMVQKDVVSWTSLISGHVRRGDFNDAFLCFGQMQLTGLKPNPVVLLAMFQACYLSASLVHGQSFHCYVIKSGMEGYLSLGNSILTMYDRTCNAEEAEKFFDMMDEKDAISWNIMISGYAFKQNKDKAIETFIRMLDEGVQPNPEALTTVISACAKLGDIMRGQEFHSFVVKNALQDVKLQTALLDMYCKCGFVALATRVFKTTPERNYVTWSRMVSGYVQNGCLNEAISLFGQMQLAGFRAGPDTLRCLMSASTHLGALSICREIHAYLFRNCFFIDDIATITSLIDTYGKCGSIIYSRRCFDQANKKDVVSWSAMIQNYALHGYALEALQLFDAMKKEGLEPNNVTFISLLSACSHAGLLDDGCQIVADMRKDSRITPGLDHYTCMVDLLGRSGHLGQAYETIKAMPIEPDSGIWGSLLGACRIHSNLNIGELASKHLFDLDPQNAGYHVVLCNINSSNMRWKKAEIMRRVFRRGTQQKKKPGWSCVEGGEGLHGFTVGDRTHPLSLEIYETLGCLRKHMEEIGLEN